MRVGWEPVLPVDLFTVGIENRVLVVLVLWYTLTLRPDYLQVLIVHPDAPLKHAILQVFDTWQNLRRHIKNKQIQFVYVIFAYIIEVIAVDLVSLEGKRVNSSKVLQIGLCQRDFLQRRQREEVDLLEANTL